ncbi:uncharacterized protein Dwil_GK13564, partial [Drosophila willistoni]
MLRLLAITLVLCASMCAARATPMEAIAYVIGPVQEDNSQVKGNVTFIQNDCGQNVHVRILLTLLKEGKHGFHIHEKGYLTNGCTSMGAHYNPQKVDHGGPDHEVRHVGDLGNVAVNSTGILNVTITDSVLSLTGKHIIIGRGVVVHEDEDDLGLGNHHISSTTGSQGF